MLEPRGVVGHGVDGSREVERGVAVAVLPLVEARDAAEVSSGSRRGDSTLGHSGHGWGVVRSVGDRGVGDVVVASDDADLADKSGVLKVAVGDSAMWVHLGDQVLLDVFRKGGPPDVALASVAPR